MATKKAKKQKQLPTEKEKQLELQKVTKLSGFRMGMHDFVAEVNLNALKERNEEWVGRNRRRSVLDRKTEELVRIAAYCALRNSVPHIQIHIHAAHQAGATPEEIYEVIDRMHGWAGGGARQNGMEAWRLVFRPDLPTIIRIVEMTTDSFKKK